MAAPLTLDPNACLAALQGGDPARNPRAPAADPSGRVGALLRQLMQERQTAMNSTPFDAEPLVARMRAAGALNGRPVPWWLRLMLRWQSLRQRPWPRGRWLTVLAGAALLVVVPRLWFTGGPTVGPPEADDGAAVMRGDSPAQRLVVPDPQATADRIAAVLARHALQTRRVERAGVIEIQAKVPAGHAAVSELAALAVATPPNGRLNLVIERPR